MSHRVYFETKSFEPDVPATDEEPAIHRSWIDAYVHIRGTSVNASGPQRLDECRGDETDAELLDRLQILWSNHDDWSVVGSMDELQ